MTDSLTVAARSRTDDRLPYGRGSVMVAARSWSRLGPVRMKHVRDEDRHRFALPLDDVPDRFQNIPILP